MGNLHRLRSPRSPGGPGREVRLRPRVQFDLRSSRAHPHLAVGSSSLVGLPPGPAHAAAILTVREPAVGGPRPSSVGDGPAPRPATLAARSGPTSAQRRGGRLPETWRRLPDLLGVRRHHLARRRSFLHHPVVGSGRRVKSHRGPVRADRGRLRHARLTAGGALADRLRLRGHADAENSVACSPAVGCLPWGALYPAYGQRGIGRRRCWPRRSSSQRPVRRGPGRRPAR